jgi:hypothetical protein
MSSMLEQSIVDASELKEAAIKNAEKIIIEKYSEEVQKALDVILEAPEEMEEDPFGAESEAETHEEVAEEVPLAATEGEKLCPCPEEGDEVEIDLKGIQQALSDSEEGENLGALQENSEEEVLFESSESDLEALLKETDESDLEALLKETDDEELEIDEDSLEEEIKEVLKVDIKNVPLGHMGGATQDERARAEEVDLASEQDDEVKEDKEARRKAVEELNEQVKSLKLENNKLSKDYDELKEISLKVSKKLNEVNFSNAKLLYTNRILESNSLNERQKDKLVEAISDAKSIEEAKVVFETMKNTISAKGVESSTSLNEAVSKNSQLVIKSNKQKKEQVSSAAERLKKLAGII